jgi:hypothetical protein
MRSVLWTRRVVGLLQLEASMSNKDFFLRMVAATNAGGGEQIAEWFTEDFKLHEPGVPLKRVTGHEGAQRMLHHVRHG